ncbi:MAG: GNAT family N-acetyltransferase [Bacillota bacterium]|nr:GNAT family N-acetyltransferase [Bacillota bacterium]
MKKIIIREAAIEDSKNIIDYINIIAGESDNLTFGIGEFLMTVEEEENYLKEIQNADNALYIIAEYNDTIIGSLNFTAGKRPRIAHVGEFGISVLKEYWGHNVGSKLIEYLIQWAQETKIIRKINLKVRVDNFGAIHLYEKYGFNIEGKTSREFMINGIFHDALMMGLEL